MIAANNRSNDELLATESIFVTRIASLITIPVVSFITTKIM
ncbi:MAG: hypothetical protein N2645_11315 [Clostridia bacterium]|nr:hypothetical protein [Clostridia bacterium]